VVRLTDGGPLHTVAPFIGTPSRQRASIALRALFDITDHRDRALSTDPSEKAEPIEKADRNDPTDPIDPNEPTEPIDRNDPLLPMHRTESSDHSDHFELAVAPSSAFMASSSRSARHRAHRVRVHGG
jgi:hypothetical protein